MDTAVRPAPLIPPAPKIHPTPLGVTPWGQLRVAWEMGRSLIGAYCEEDYESLATPYLFMGQPGLFLNDPAGARYVLTSPNYVRPVWPPGSRTSSPRELRQADRGKA